MTNPAPGVRAEFSCEPDPGNPGWNRWRLSDPTRYLEAVLGPVLVRSESQDSARVRIVPQQRHTNSANNIHGAIILGLIDVALFAALHVVRGASTERAFTVDLSTQFISVGDACRPLDAVVQVLSETRRLAFLR